MIRILLKNNYIFPIGSCINYKANRVSCPGAADNKINNKKKVDINLS